MESLYRSEALYRTIVEGAPVGVSLSNPEGKVIIANEAYQRMVGYSIDELRSLHFSEITHPDDVQLDVDLFHDTLAGNRTGYAIEKRYVRKDGQLLWVRLSVSLVRDPEGNAIGEVAIVEDIGARKLAEKRLRESEERHRQMFERNHAIKLLVDPGTGEIVDANPAARRFYGRSLAELRALKIHDINALSREDVDAEMARAHSQERAYFVFRHRLATGEVRDVEVHSSPVDIQGRALLYSIIHDITDRKQVEEALLESERRLRAITESATDAIVSADRDGQVVSWNAAAGTIFGYAAGEIVGKSVTALMPERYREAHRRGMIRFLNGGEARVVGSTVDWHGLRKDGSEFPVEVSLSTWKTGDEVFFTGIMRDGTERKRTEEELIHWALHDALTGLPNRVLLRDRLDQTMALARRSGTPVALLVIDLDHFKEINDTFGHHYGDIVLQHLGPRLRDALRRSDSVLRLGSPTVARLGGDEFAVVLPNTSERAAVRVVGRVLKTLVEPVLVDGHRLSVDASIGIALSVSEGDDAADLLRQADVAMYLAKQTRSGYAVYDAARDRNSPDRHLLTDELRQALKRGGLHLNYQPQIACLGRGFLRAEALVRWHHRERGLVPPSDFIALAEHTGLVKPLTEWVLRTALQQCRHWRESGREVSIAVNLSAQSLLDTQLGRTIGRLLRSTGADGSWLQVEITENAVMADPERSMAVLQRLRGMDIRVSIDDFGTGYSSLAYLKRLPVDEVKIDRSFVTHMAINEEDAIIVRSVVDLAHNLGLEVVAEGVEDQAAVDLLVAMGCDVMQGYYLSRPLSSSGMTEWLSNEREPSWNRPADLVVRRPPE